jgi:hypothetical protein
MLCRWVIPDVSKTLRCFETSRTNQATQGHMSEDSNLEDPEDLKITLFERPTTQVSVVNKHLLFSACFFFGLGPSSFNVNKM